MTASTEPLAEMLDELIEWLRIPSISSGGGRPEDLERAATWAADKLRAAGGTAELVPGKVNPLVVGELRAADVTAPSILVYGHYDVQSPEPANAWTSQPFRPEVRDGRLYARGASDDKGNFFPLLHVACRLAPAGGLPLNLRFLIEGEEEIGGASALEWVSQDQGELDAAVVFDGAMVDERTPSLILGVRGVVMCDVEVRTASRDLHSGIYGGSVLNAAHVLMDVLAAVLPDEDGSLPDRLRHSIALPSREELEAWAKLPPGDQVLAAAGAKPLTPESGADYYARNGADASVDVHGIEVGDARQVRTMVPATARAKVSMRLAPGQRSNAMADEFISLMRAAAPPGAEVQVSVLARAEPALFRPDSRALSLAREVLHEVCGVEPALTRVGGSLPLLAALAQRDVPTIFSGFALADDNVHAVDESFRLESLALGERAAHALFARLAELKNP